MLDLKTTAEALRGELAASDEITRGLLMAMAITQLENMLLAQNHLQALNSLHNSPLGYLTDETKDRRYNNTQVAAFVVHCLLDGDPLYGGHVMIFGGKKYRTKVGWMRLLREAKVTELDIRAAAPQDVVETRNQSGSLKATGKCSAYAQCRLGGQVYRVDLSHTPQGDFRVDVDGNGKDISACRVQMRGKAEARVAARLYQLITGIDSGEEESPPTQNILPEMPDNWKFSPETEASLDRIVAQVEAEKVAKQEKTQRSPIDELTDRATTLANQVNPESGEALLRHHEAMQAATSNSELNDAWKKFETEHATNKYDGRVKGHLQSLGAAMREVLSGQ